MYNLIHVTTVVRVHETVSSLLSGPTHPCPFQGISFTITSTLEVLFILTRILFFLVFTGTTDYKPYISHPLI